jgi:hypothetical protein
LPAGHYSIRLAKKPDSTQSVTVRPEACLAGINLDD